eukprot:TRINITY_DN15037_c0_g1_i1.p1 TRINITY_DN15037_c0_g1~~TRINITY_DN15037_c0_g1_i1.p1  ORF type:complete len:772 (-),score=141.67 TRINITY_DN15037_c0_g1_i1:129-2444(-)
MQRASSSRGGSPASPSQRLRPLDRSFSSKGEDFQERSWTAAASTAASPSRLSRLGTSQSLSSLDQTRASSRGTWLSPQSHTKRAAEQNRACQVSLGAFARVEAEEWEGRTRRALQELAPPSLPPGGHGRGLRGLLLLSEGARTPASGEGQISPLGCTGRGTLGGRSSPSGASVSEAVVDETIRKTFDACWEESNAIQQLLESRAKRAIQAEEGNAIGEEEERRLQLEEKKKELFRERQKARDPFRRLQVRLDGARGKAEAGGDGEESGIDGGSPGGKERSVPMMVIGVPGPSGKDACHVVDVRRLQSMSWTLGRGMGVEEMVALKKKRDKEKLGLPVLRRINSCPGLQQPKLSMTEKVYRARTRHKVCQLAKFMHTVGHMRSELPADDFQRLQDDTSGTLQVALQTGNEMAFLRAWFEKLGVAQEILQWKVCGISAVKRRLRRFRGVIRIFIICSAFLRKRNHAAEVLKNFFNRSKLKSLPIQLMQVKHRVHRLCTNFIMRREKRREEMERYWTAVEDGFLSKWASRILSAQGSEKGEASAYLEACGTSRKQDEDEEATNVLRGIWENWRQLRIPDQQRNVLISQYYNARLRRFGMLQAKRSTTRRKSTMQARPFWKVNAEEALELIGICARSLREIHPFQWHPANKLPDDTAEFDEQKGRKVRRTLLFMSLNLLADSDANPIRGAAASDFIQKEVLPAEPDSTPKAGSSAPWSSSSAVPALELAGESNKTEDLGELLDRFTPRLCWHEIVGQSSGTEPDDSDDFEDHVSP